MKPRLTQPAGPIAASEAKPLLADLFHALNQPLTTMRCSLELALHQPRSLEQYREEVRGALERAEQVIRLVAGIRQLVEAEDPGDDRRVPILESALREVVADLAPLAELLQVRLLVRCDSPGQVRFEAHRLRQALFLLLEFALSSSPCGAAVEIHLAESAQECVLTVTTIPIGIAAEETAAEDEPEWKAKELEQRLGLATARRMFETAGGHFGAEENGEPRRLEIRLPRAASAAT